MQFYKNVIQRYSLPNRPQGLFQVSVHSDIKHRNLHRHIMLWNNDFLPAMYSSRPTVWQGNVAFCVSRPTVWQGNFVFCVYGFTILKVCVHDFEGLVQGMFFLLQTTQCHAKDKIVCLGAPCAWFQWSSPQDRRRGVGVEWWWAGYGEWGGPGSRGSSKGETNLVTLNLDIRPTFKYHWKSLQYLAFGTVSQTQIKPCPGLKSILNGDVHRKCCLVQD